MASIIEQIFTQAGGGPTAQGQSLPLVQALQRGQEMALDRRRFQMEQRQSLEDIETANLNQRLLAQQIRFNDQMSKLEKSEAMINIQKMESMREATVAASGMHASALRNPEQVNTPEFQSDVATLMEENPYLFDTTQGQALASYMESRGVDMGIGDPLRRLELELKKEQIGVAKERIGVEKEGLDVRRADIARLMAQAEEGMDDFERAQFESGLDAISRDKTLVTSDQKIQAQINFIRDFRKKLRKRRSGSQAGGGGRQGDAVDIGTQPSLAEFLFGEQPGNQSDPAGLFQDETNPLPSSIGQPFNPNRFE